MIFFESSPNGSWAHEGVYSSPKKFLPVFASTIVIVDFESRVSPTEISHFFPTVVATLKVF